MNSPRGKRIQNPKVSCIDLNIFFLLFPNSKIIKNVGEFIS